MNKGVKFGLLAAALLPIHTGLAATITLDDVHDPSTGAAGTGFATFTSTITTGPGPLSSAELFPFAGTFVAPSGGPGAGARLVVLTEPGSGSGPTALISDILLYGVTPRIGLGGLGARAVAGFLLSFDGGEPTVGTALSGILSALNSNIGTALPPGVSLPQPFITEETGALQEFSIAGTGLRVFVESSVPSAVPDGGATLALLGLSVCGLAVVKRRS